MYNENEIKECEQAIRIEIERLIGVAASWVGDRLLPLFNRYVELTQRDEHGDS